MKSKLLVTVGVIGGSLLSFYSDEVKVTSVGALRFGRAALTVVSITGDYRKFLYSRSIDKHSSEYITEKSKVHLRSAQKLLQLCCVNGGAFIKVGQHLGSLEYLLPYEYVNTLKILHSEAPQSPLKDIYDVIRLEFNKEPSELFDEFDSEPLGAASLAQVHRARLKDGREVAVKVQHPTVLDHSKIDMKGMEILVNVVSRVFPDFNFDWLVDEMKKNLPIELDFSNEGKNAERIANMFAHLPWLKVPTIDWTLTTKRVLTMEYCEGGQVNDQEYMKTHGIDGFEVSKKLGDLYSEMIFVSGFVHCDPHPGNVLVKKQGNKTDIILLDHGLYTTLTEKFRLTYAKLWQSILNADLKAIEFYSRELGLGDLYGLFTCMVTARSWNSITRGINTEKITSKEEEEIKDDAAKFLPEISEVLNRVPRQMLLIFKTNDLIRGIEYSLNTNKSMKSFISMSRCCIRAVYDEQRKSCTSRWCFFKAHVAENVAQCRLSMYTLFLWVIRMPFIQLLLSKCLYDNQAKKCLVL